MLKTIDRNNTERVTVEQDDDFYCVIRGVGGAILRDADEAYFQKAIIEAGGFELDGKAIALWEKKTGFGVYKNGKRVYLGAIPWHEILPPVVANQILLKIDKMSQLTEDERKN